METGRSRSDGSADDGGAEEDRGDCDQRGQILGRARMLVIASRPLEAVAFDHAQIARGDDMRRLVLAAALVAAWAGLARAGDPVDDVAEAYGEAVAFDELCPTLKLSDAAITFYAGAVGGVIDDGVVSEAGFYQRRALAQWRGKPARTVCAEGQRLFGYSGSKAPSLLVPQ